MAPTHQRGKVFALFTAETFFEDDFNGLAGLFSNCAAYFQLNGQHMPAVAHGHERTLEPVTVDSAFHLDGATGAKEFH